MMYYKTKSNSMTAVIFPITGMADAGKKSIDHINKRICRQRRHLLCFQRF